MKKNWYKLLCLLKKIGINYFKISTKKKKKNIISNQKITPLNNSIQKKIKKNTIIFVNT
jgi:hypothetical protein